MPPEDRWPKFDFPFGQAVAQEYQDQCRSTARLVLGFRFYVAREHQVLGAASWQGKIDRVAHFLPCLFPSHHPLLTMPKRKRGRHSFSRISTCPILSDFMMELVRETLRAHQPPGGLKGKTQYHRSMITTRYSVPNICMKCADHSTRIKLRSSYDDSVVSASVIASTEPYYVHSAEFRHAALTLALAITNSCEYLT